MNKSLTILIFLVFNTHLLFAQTAVKKEVFSRAGKIIIVEHKPEDFNESKKYPLLIIAPDYSGMDENIITSIAAGAKRIGFFVLRFNFVLKENKASKSLKKEINTLLEIKALYSSKDFIDTKNINILAKGFGSRVLMRTNLSKYNSLGLLNPLCDKRFSFSRLFSPFIKSKRPNLITMNFNNGVCRPNLIYSALSKNKNTYIQIHKGSSSKLYSDKNTSSIMALSIINWLSARVTNLPVN